LLLKYLEVYGLLRCWSMSAIPFREMRKKRKERKTFVSDWD
jgi:hypothetical protein